MILFNRLEKLNLSYKISQETHNLINRNQYEKPTAMKIPALPESPLKKMKTPLS